MTHKYYTVCIATTGKDNKTYFTKVGAAFPGKEGSKAIMSIKLDAHSLNGEYVLFEPKSPPPAKTTKPTSPKLARRFPAKKAAKPL